MKFSHLLELLLLAAVWGASFLFTRIAVPVLGPVLLIELRVLLASVTLLLVATRFNLISEIRKNLIPLLVIGCINTAIPYLLFAVAALYIPAGFASILKCDSFLRNYIGEYQYGGLRAILRVTHSGLR